MGKILIKILFAFMLFISVSADAQWQNEPFEFFGDNSYSINARLYFARYDIKPSGDTLKWYAEFIDSLTLNGAWAALDEFGIFANNTTANALLGVKGYKNCTSVNSPVFTSYRGFKSNGSTSYINTNYTPGTHGVLMTTNSVSFGVYSRTDTSDLNPIIGLTAQSPSTSVMYIYPKYSDNKLYFEPNTTSGTHGVTVSNSLGLMTANRSRSDSITAYKNGIRIGNIAAVSTFLITGYPMLICTANKSGGPTEFTKREVVFWFVGGSLTAQQQLNLYNCLQRLLTKIGASV